MPLLWKKAPESADKITTALVRAQAQGPASLAEVATLSMWLHWLKARDGASDAYPGIFLMHMASLLRNLVEIDSGPIPMPFLGFWMDDLQPQVDVPIVTKSADDDTRLQQYIEATASQSPAEARIRTQQMQLQPFLEEGNEFLLTGALTQIKQTYLARDWKSYFQYGISLDHLIAQLQPYAETYRTTIFQFLSDLLIENARAAHFDPLLITSCLNWFLVTWSGRDELTQLADAVTRWQAHWPVVVLCVHNRIGRTIRVVQFNSADAPFDKTNRLLHTSGGRPIGSMLAQKDRIKRNDEAYFVLPLPDGDGDYRLRIEAGGMARVIFRATTETTATLKANQAYVWTVSAAATDQVKPLEFVDAQKTDQITGA